MTQKKKNNIIIGSLCAVVLLMVVGYAAFSSILDIKGTSIIGSNWRILITNIEEKNIVGGASTATNGTGAKKITGIGSLTASFETNLVSPGDSIEYDITVSNQGSLNAVLEKINVSDSNNPAIQFTTTGLTEGDPLNAGGTAVLTVKVEYDNAVTSQPDNTKSELTVTLDYVQKEGNSGVTSEPITPSDLISKVVTSGDGLYADEYESGRYIYKGTNPDNYITFNDETWRILSVENDGILKIMKVESLGNIPFDTTGGTPGSNSWARPADLNTYLNNDYYNSLNSESRNLIQNHTWSIGIAEFNNSDLAGQIQSENGTIWNGNIGLMTASEFLRVNTNTSQCGNYSLNQSNYSTCKVTNYIVPLTGTLWTISPYASSSSNVFGAGSSGRVNFTNARDVNIGVAPALYLIPNITLSGEGTSGNPYTIIS